MTIVVADTVSGIMIADTRVVEDNIPIYTATKIFEAEDGSLIGAAGDADACALFLEWAMGACRAPPPEPWGDCRGIRLTPERKIELYDLHVPDYVIDTELAIGAGAREFNAARRAGASIEVAVQIACDLHPLCGGALTLLHLSPASNKRRRRK